jgi:hypothetical protein
VVLPLMPGRWFVPGDGRVIVLTRVQPSEIQHRRRDMVTLDLGEMVKDSGVVPGSVLSLSATITLKRSMHRWKRVPDNQKYNQGSYCTLEQLHTIPIVTIDHATRIYTGSQLENLRQSNAARPKVSMAV